jgi:hypothetical protein
MGCGPNQSTSALVASLCNSSEPNEDHAYPSSLATCSAYTGQKWRPEDLPIVKAIAPDFAMFEVEAVLDG